METKTLITEVGRVIVPVRDQDRAIEFYTGTLGFEKRADIPYGNGDRWVEVAPPGATTALALCLPMGDGPVGVQTGISLSTGDIDAAHAHLKAQGTDADEVMRMGGPVPPMFWFRDPDGNTLLLVEPQD